MPATAAQILDALPQTQCTRCGYPDCAGYAQAIAAGQAAINQCPPGGAAGVARLAQLTGLAPLPLDPAFGTEGQRKVAVIDEDWCIGCTLCLDVCPTDAILGGNKSMHTVIEPHCTGCELCIPVCPVDCIEMENVSADRTGWAAWSQAQADTARARYSRHVLRPPRNAQDIPPRLEAMAPAKRADLPAHAPDIDLVAQEKKRVFIEAALARLKARQQTQG